MLFESHFQDRFSVSHVVACELLQPGLRVLLSALKIRVRSLDRSGDGVEGKPIGLSRELQSVCQLTGPSRTRMQLLI